MSFSENLKEHYAALKMLPALEEKIVMAAKIISESICSGGKLLLVGNGGSAADCQHLAAEFIGRFGIERRALPAIALTVDSSALTSVANDFGYDYVFSRQIEGLADKGDVLLAFSTSGNSLSIINAINSAKSRSVRIISILGRDGGKAKNLADCEIIVPSQSTARIQEMHIFLGHCICDEVERNI